MAKSMTVGKRENEKKRLAKREEKLKKKEDFYQNIKEELDVPEYFGNNLDALYDFLTEQPDILQMKFLHYNMMQSQLGRSFCQQLLKVLQDADILTIIEEY